MLLLLLACDPAPDGYTVTVTGTSIATDANGQTVVVKTVERAAPPSPNAGACAEPVSDEAACFSHGESLLYGGDWAGLEEVWYAQCKRGFAPACGELAYQYSNPYAALPHRAERAGEVLQRACDLHAKPISCALLADAVRDGQHGFLADPARANALRERACADGHVHSCP